MICDGRHGRLGQSQITDRKSSLSTRALPHRPVRLPPEILFPNGIPFVVKLLALDKGYLGLGPRALEIERERYAGASPRRNGARPPVERPPVEQQLAVAFRQMVSPGARAVGRDVCAHEKGLARPELNIRVLELRSPLSQRLDFRS